MTCLRPSAFTLAFFFSTVLLAGCNGSDTGGCVASECACTADGCACPDGSACGGFTTTGSCNDDGSSCSLACDSSSDCVGSCGDSCGLDCVGTDCVLVAGRSASVECRDAASCEVTCGDSCSVNCKSGSSCDFICTGESCSMSCEPDTTCRMQCPGEDGLQEVAEGRSC